VIGSRLAMKRRRVTADQIRKAHRAEPFVPFVLRLTNGREVAVRGRGLMLLTPRSRTIAVYDTDDAYSIIDVAFVEGIELKRASRKRRRA
jgi:hypothetical protein